MSDETTHDLRRKLSIALSCLLLAETLCLCFIGVSRPNNDVTNAVQVIRYQPSERTDAPILLLGTDAEGLRTDVIILAGFRKSDHAPILISLPRDTLIQTLNGADKLNAVYAVYGGGQEGVAALKTVLHDQLGVTVRNYMLADLAAFEKLVDETGGIWYDVPVEMHYADPTQDLKIDLSAGYQKLNGVQALGLVRYRNYFFGDIDRTKVQQSFLKTAAKQVLEDKSAIRLLRFAELTKEYVQTDLSLGDMINYALMLSRCDFAQIQCGTLPGDGKMIDGVDYYCLDEVEAKKMLALFAE